MHSFYGTSGDMSMSADPTCQGLQSPTLGVITMNFDKSKWNVDVWRTLNHNMFDFFIPSS